MASAGKAFMRKNASFAKPPRCTTVDSRHPTPLKMGYIHGKSYARLYFDFKTVSTRRISAPTKDDERTDQILIDARRSVTENELFKQDLMYVRHMQEQLKYF